MHFAFLLIVAPSSVVTLIRRRDRPTIEPDPKVSVVYENLLNKCEDKKESRAKLNRIARWGEKLRNYNWYKIY